MRSSIGSSASLQRLTRTARLALGAPSVITFLPLALLAFLALLLLVANAGAQLIDPNNNCVYQPGSRNCQPIRQPAVPHLAGTPYQQFLSFVSNINLRQHPSYTEQYVDQRGHLYCGLLAQGEMMKILQDVQYPPTQWLETPHDRPRLEVAILRTAALNYCPRYWPQERQFEYTFVR